MTRTRDFHFDKITAKQDFFKSINFFTCTKLHRELPKTYTYSKLSTRLDIANEIDATRERNFKDAPLQSFWSQESFVVPATVE